MAKFFSLKVADVRKETNECVSIAFEISNEFKKFFNYVQGQYITLKLTIDDEELRRSYSICSSPLIDAEFRIASKKVTNGKVSTYLFEKVKVGDVLDVMTPMGNFYAPLQPEKEKNYALFAGGSGITPVFSIIKTVLHAEPKSKVILFYGNRDEKSIIFHDALNGLEKNFQQSFKVYHVLEKPMHPADSLFTGMLTVAKTDELLKKFTVLNKVNEFFICGPLPMMNNIQTSLEKSGVSKELIHIEYFTTVLEDIAKAEKAVAPHAIPALTSKVTVVLDGSETLFELQSKGKSILDAAIENGVDAPFACKGAVCCTCKAKLIEGKVDMDMNYALTPNEIANGYILTCQSHPVSETVVVSYDAI